MVRNTSGLVNASEAEPSMHPTPSEPPLQTASNHYELIEGNISLPNLSSICPTNPLQVGQLKMAVSRHLFSFCPTCPTCPTAFHIIWSNARCFFPSPSPIRAARSPILTRSPQKITSLSITTPKQVGQVGQVGRCCISCCFY